MRNRDLAQICKRILLLCCVLILSLLLLGCEGFENSGKSMPSENTDNSEAPNNSEVPDNSPTEAPTDAVTPKATNSPSPTSSPTPEPILEYTTNTLQVAREGKTGMYSYTASEGDMQDYILIDLDEKEFYLFYLYPKTPSENFGACFLITGGDLNSGLSVEGYMEDTISLSCKFEKKGEPGVLIFTDGDGSTMTFQATSMPDMLDVIEDFEVFDCSNPANVVRSNTPTPTPKSKSYTGKLDWYEEDYLVYYVVNINTYKFHNPGCRHIKKMYEENTNYATDHGFATKQEARDWLIDQGYDSCGTCCP